MPGSSFHTRTDKVAVLVASWDTSILHPLHVGISTAGYFSGCFDKTNTIAVLSFESALH